MLWVAENTSRMHNPYEDFRKQINALIETRILRWSNFPQLLKSLIKIYPPKVRARNISLLKKILNRLLCRKKRTTWMIALWLLPFTAAFHWQIYLITHSVGVIEWLSWIHWRRHWRDRLPRRPDAHWTEFSVSLPQCLSISFSQRDAFRQRNKMNALLDATDALLTRTSRYPE